jgi:hypothetical protein
MQAINPQLARINLESNSSRPPVWVGFLSFLEFSQEISEDLADLVAKYELTSHRSSFSLSRPLTSPTTPATV